MRTKKVLIFLGIIVLGAVLSAIGTYSYLISKVSHYHKMTCDMKPYEQNSFISCENYVWLSPYYTDIYDFESGEIIDSGHSIHDYQEDYYFFVPYYSFSRGCLALAGHYSYVYHRDDRKTGAQGVYYIYFGLDANGFHIEDIDYNI